MLRGDLRLQFRQLGLSLRRKVETAGILSDLAHSADRWRATKQGKAAVGRGGRPLDPEHARDLERIFKTDAVVGFAKLIESDVDAFDIDLTGVLAEDYAELYAAGGAAARAQLGVRGVFNLRSPFILDALEERANMLAGGIADEIFDRMKTVVAEDFYILGQSPIQVARGLRDEFDWLGETRSELIARTETGIVTSASQHQVYELSGVEEKRWISIRDARTRFAHKNAHGQTRPLDEPFELEDEHGEVFLLDHPHDENADISMIIQCRCAEIPIIDAEHRYDEGAVWDGVEDPEDFEPEGEGAPEEVA
jgi:hypothetical protein